MIVLTSFSAVIIKIIVIIKIGGYVSILFMIKVRNSGSAAKGFQYICVIFVTRLLVL